MASNTIRKFRWIWAWQDDVEEKWFREMSLKGWHLTGYDFAGFYTFTKGEPHDYIYRMDYQPNSPKDEVEYLQLFRDGGWEQVAKYLSWHYFRKDPKPGETNEIFTDAETRIAKYNRLIRFVLAAGIPSLVVLAVFSITDEKSHWFNVFNLFGALIIGHFLYVYFKVRQKIKALKTL